MQETKLQSEEKLTAELACVEDYEVDGLTTSANPQKKMCHELQASVRLKLLSQFSHHA